MHKNSFSFDAKTIGKELMRVNIYMVPYINFTSHHFLIWRQDCYGFYFIIGKTDTWRGHVILSKSHQSNGYKAGQSGFRVQHLPTNTSTCRLFSIQQNLCSNIDNIFIRILMDRSTKMVPQWKNWNFWETFTHHNNHENRYRFMYFFFFCLAWLYRIRLITWNHYKF